MRDIGGKQFDETREMLYQLLAAVLLFSLSPSAVGGAASFSIAGWQLRHRLAGL